MSPLISLRNFVDEMQSLTEESHGYVNKVTGELVSIRDEDIQLLEETEIDEEDEESDQAELRDIPEWQKDALEEVERVLSSEDYLEIPSKFEAHEYRMMEKFCLGYPDEEISEVLYDQIRGSGAFRRFRNSLDRYGIADDWYKYRDEAYKEIAIAWLEENGLAYTDDMDRGDVK